MNYVVIHYAVVVEDKEEKEKEEEGEGGGRNGRK